MLVEQVHGPEDLRGLDGEALAELAADLRQHVIRAVAPVGGHLGSNLGAVELTIALHRGFDSPHDILLWDTGHQAYVHKMLTGRAHLFDTLRQDDGLAGYPQRAESPHDVIENSHASTALSWACGIAEGQRFLPEEERRSVVAIVGDGALTGGMAYEALNNIGHDHTPLTIVLNDNGRSYAETVSRLSSQVSRVRMDPRYRTWRGRLDAWVDGVPLVHRITGASLRGIKHAVADAPALQAFVEALGIGYLGPVDGHDIAAMDAAFAAARRFTRPVLVHVLTEKGKGYEPAEADPEKRLHDTSPFDPATGEATSASRRSWTAAFSDALLEVVEEVEEVVAITAAMPGSTGLLPIAERHPERVMDVGIAEQHAVTSAAGLAYAGRIPVVAIYSPFFPRAFDQANLDVALHDEHVVFAFDRAGITGPDGPSAHGVLDLALALRIPGMTVLAPSSDAEVHALLRTAVQDVEGPVSLRYGRGACPAGDGVGEGLHARLVRDGHDATILAVGDRVGPAVAAARMLAADGHDVAVWDVRSVRPLDQDMVRAAAASPLVVTVENGVVSGGAGAFMADAVVDEAGIHDAPPVVRLGVPDSHIAHGSPDRILSSLGLDADGITATVRKALDAR